MNPANPGELTLSFDHSIYYTNHELIPAHEVAEALLALDRMVHRAPQALRALLPGTSTVKMELFVKRLQSGSLTEDVTIKLLFGSKRQMDRTLKRFREKYGINLTSKSGVIRTILFTLIILGGAYAGHRALMAAAKPTVEISHNTIINIGAEELHLTADELVKIIAAAVPNKSQLAHDAVSVVKPAKREGQAEIRIDGNQSELKISAEEVANFPAEVHTDKTEESEQREHVEIHLRANDLDNTERGWAAVVPTVTARRLRLELAPAINADDLFGKKEIRGTVEIIRRKDANGRLQLRAYRLEAIDPPAE